VTRLTRASQPLSRSLLVIYHSAGALMLDSTAEPLVPDKTRA
jgi:hypothetical protein